MPETPGSHDPAAGIQGFGAACLTVSDRVAAGVYEDVSGPRLEALAVSLGGLVVASERVPDEVDAIRSVLQGWLAQAEPPALILTSGGTGPAPRDVTPEATSPLVERRFPGVEDALRRGGLPEVATALLSRGLVGTTGTTLIVNLPGSPGAVADAAEVLAPLVGHIIGQLLAARSGA